MFRRYSAWILAAVLAISFAAVHTSCTGPYSNKAERLKKPKKKKRPKSEAAMDMALDDKCRTNFFDDPVTRRQPRQGRRLAKQAEDILFEAEDQDGMERVELVRKALGKLRSALKQDPYGPEATYKMAVAYAMVGKKGCAVKLLDRLQSLTNMPDVESLANRTVQRAVRDQTFDPFRQDADAALGQ